MTERLKRLKKEYEMMERAEGRLPAHTTGRKFYMKMDKVKDRMEKEERKGGKVSHRPKSRGYSMFNDKTIRGLG